MIEVQQHQSAADNQPKLSNVIKIMNTTFPKAAEHKVGEVKTESTDSITIKSRTYEHSSALQSEGYLGQNQSLLNPLLNGNEESGESSGSSGSLHGESENSMEEGQLNDSYPHGEASPLGGKVGSETPEASHINEQYNHLLSISIL